jgi:glutaconyl-CoA/methylmalonyl-CoA decarboxylase subunit gamma
MKLRRVGDGGELEVEILARDGERIRALVLGREIEATLEPGSDRTSIITIGGRRCRTAAVKTRAGVIVAVGPSTFEFSAVEEGARRHGRGLAAPEVTAPMPGKVLKVMVSEGETVEAGQALVVIEAMKMETTLAAESPAMIKRIRVSAGQMVDHGAVLIELSPAADSSARESDPQAS